MIDFRIKIHKSPFLAHLDFLNLIFSEKSETFFRSKKLSGKNSYILKNSRDKLYFTQN